MHASMSGTRDHRSHKVHPAGDAVRDAARVPRISGAYASSNAVHADINTEGHVALRHVALGTPTQVHVTIHSQVCAMPPHAQARKAKYALLRTWKGSSLA